MRPLVQTLFDYIIELNFLNFYTTLFNQYFPFGFIWWFFGFAIFGITHMKTKNLAYSCGLMSVYFAGMPYTGLITNAYSVMFMGYAGLLTGLVAGYYFYQLIRG